MPYWFLWFLILLLSEEGLYVLGDKHPAEENDFPVCKDFPLE